MQLRANILTKQHHARWTLIGALLLALTACASQTSGAHGPFLIFADHLPDTCAVDSHAHANQRALLHRRARHDAARGRPALCAPTTAGDVLAINPATGATKWSVSEGTSVSLLATDHALYVSYGDHLDALRPERWRTALERVRWEHDR